MSVVLKNTWRTLKKLKLICSNSKDLMCSSKFNKRIVSLTTPLHLMYVKTVVKGLFLCFRLMKMCAVKFYAINLLRIYLIECKYPNPIPYPQIVLIKNLKPD